MNYSIPSMKWFNAMRILVPLGLLYTIINGFSTYRQMQEVFSYYPGYKTITILEIVLNVIILAALCYCLMTYNHLSVTLCYAVIASGVLLSIIIVAYCMSADILNATATTIIIFSMVRVCAFYIPSAIYLNKRLVNPFSGEKMRSKADWDSFVLEVQSKNTPEMV